MRPSNLLSGFVNQLMLVFIAESLICLYGVALFDQDQWLAWLGMGCFIGGLACAAAVSLMQSDPNQGGSDHEAT